MVDRLNEPESRFHATLVTNIFDLVELLPRLNVTGDPELNRFAEEARQKLCTYTAHDLKKHELLRVATAADAAGIVSRMDEAIRNREASRPKRNSPLSRAFLTICRRTWRRPRRHETQCHSNHKLAGIASLWL